MDLTKNLKDKQKCQALKVLNLLFICKSDKSFAQNFKNNITIIKKENDFNTYIVKTKHNLGK